MAAIIGYLPFIFSAFGTRETNITLLDARAGTPPTAGELLRRHSFPNGEEALEKLLEKWKSGALSFWRAIFPTPYWPTSGPERRQSILDRLSHCDPGHLRPHDRRDRRYLRETG